MTLWIKRGLCFIFVSPTDSSLYIYNNWISPIDLQNLKMKYKSIISLVFECSTKAINLQSIYFYIIMEFDHKNDI